MSSAPFLLPSFSGSTLHRWPALSQSQTLSHKFRAWLPVLLCASVFAVESTRAFGTDHTSKPLHDFFQLFLGSAIDQGWTFTHHIIRKIGHFSGYGVFSLVCFRAFWLTLRKSSSGIPIRARRTVATGLHSRFASKFRTQFRARISAHFPSRFKVQLACHALAIGATLLVASADEIHQSFLPNRTGTFADVVLDTTGATALQLALCLILLMIPKWPFAPAKGGRTSSQTATRASLRGLTQAA